MVYFQTKNPNLGKLWRVLKWNMSVYYVAIWSILWSFGVFYRHLVYFMVIWYMLWTFLTFYGHLVYFSPFWYVVPGKIWQPWFAMLWKERKGAESGQRANKEERNRKMGRFPNLNAIPF
jgi:hypothetical protein